MYAISRMKIFSMEILKYSSHCQLSFCICTVMNWISKKYLYLQRPCPNLCTPIKKIMLSIKAVFRSLIRISWMFGGSKLRYQMTISFLDVIVSEYTYEYTVLFFHNFFLFHFSIRHLRSAHIPIEVHILPITKWRSGGFQCYTLAYYINRNVKNIPFAAICTSIEAFANIR